MNSVVADTDVVSYSFKNHPFGSRYDADLVGRIPLISFMTVAEIERWVLQYLLRSQEDYGDVFRLAKHEGQHSTWKPFLAQVLGFNADLVSSTFRFP